MNLLHRVAQPEIAPTPLESYLESLLREPEDTLRPSLPPVPLSPPQSDEDAGRELSPLWQRCGETFQVLQFTIHGMALAVPLEDMARIVNLGDSANLLPGEDSSSIGSMDSGGRRVRILDPAALGFCGRLAGQMAGGDRSYSHALLAVGFDWGLACNAVGTVSPVNRANIDWKTPLGSRAWLAGTLTGVMAPLIDFRAIAAKMA